MLIPELPEAGDERLKLKGVIQAVGSIIYEKDGKRVNYTQKAKGIRPKLRITGIQDPKIRKELGGAEEKMYMYRGTRDSIYIQS